MNYQDFGNLVTSSLSLPLPRSPTLDGVDGEQDHVLGSGGTRSIKGYAASAGLAAAEVGPTLRSYVRAMEEGLRFYPRHWSRLYTILLEGARRILTYCACEWIALHASAAITGEEEGRLLATLVRTTLVLLKQEDDPSGAVEGAPFESEDWMVIWGEEEGEEGEWLLPGLSTGEVGEREERQGSAARWPNETGKSVLYWLCRGWESGTVHLTR